MDPVITSTSTEATVSSDNRSAVPPLITSAARHSFLESANMNLNVQLLNYAHQLRQQRSLDEPSSTNTSQFRPLGQQEFRSPTGMLTGDVSAFTPASLSSFKATSVDNLQQLMGAGIPTIQPSESMSSLDCRGGQANSQRYNKLRRTRSHTAGGQVSSETRNRLKAMLETKQARKHNVPTSTSVFNKRGMGSGYEPYPLHLGTAGRMHPASDATAAALTAMVIDDVEKPKKQAGTSKMKTVNFTADTAMQDYSHAEVTSQLQQHLEQQAKAKQQQAEQQKKQQQQHEQQQQSTSSQQQQSAQQQQLQLEQQQQKELQLDELRKQQQRCLEEQIRKHQEQLQAQQQAVAGGSTAPDGSAGGRSAFELFALRKVSSEPNLAMKELLRAKILNRTQHLSDEQELDPITLSLLKSQQYHQLRSAANAAADQGDPPLLGSPPGRLIDMDSMSSVCHPHPMIAAPSLPNLHSNIPHLGSGGLDANLWAQALASGLLGGGQQPNDQPLHPSVLQAMANDPLMAAAAIQHLRNIAAAANMSSGFDDADMAGTSYGNGVNQAGGGMRGAMHSFAGPSTVLKQQLHDLMMRRKSLVPEETETDVLIDVNEDDERGDEDDPMHGRKTGLAYEASMCKHQCVCGENRYHIEHGGRVQSIWSRLCEAGLVGKCERVPVRKASLDALRLCHSDTFVTFFGVSPAAALKMGAYQLPLRLFLPLPCGGMGVDSDTYFNDSVTPTAARMSTGALLELCTQVVEGRVRNGFAVIRPPGHHAEREQAMGFCYFNNVAIAAKYLQTRHRYRKIAIVDWDVHHGNGTQEMFESDPSVLYVSLHRHDNGNFFPGTGAVTECGTGLAKGTIVNIPFSGEQPMCDADYLAAWRVVVEPVLTEFQPEFIIVSAGFDAADGHSNALGGYKLTAQLFGYMTDRLMGITPHGKVVLALEGGYELSVLADCAEECTSVLCGNKTSNISRETLNEHANREARDAILKVVAVQKRYWECLRNTTNDWLTKCEADYDTDYRLPAQLQSLTTTEQPTVEEI